VIRGGFALELLFVLSLLANVALLGRVYRLGRRWRAFRYAWEAMSHFASTRLAGDAAGARWLQVLGEQNGFVCRFGAQKMTPAELRSYELAVAKRGIPTLRQHRMAQADSAELEPWNPW
jgi:hypothetical protein